MNMVLRGGCACGEVKYKLMLLHYLPKLVIVKTVKFPLALLLLYIQ